MKISVITVAYNSDTTIGEAVGSVARQVYGTFEHLIIDGASSDRTVDVARLHAITNAKIISEPDGGIYEAMNKGFELADGDVIGFLNADDMFADDQVLSRIATVFEHSEIEACFGDLVYVTEDNRKVVRYWKSRPHEKGSFARGWSPAHPTFYIRRSALSRLGLFNLTYRLAADAEFMMRYLECGEVQSAYIPHVQVRMRVGGATNQSWRNVIRQNREIMQALKKNSIPYSPISFVQHKLANRLRQRLEGLVMRESK